MSKEIDVIWLSLREGTPCRGYWDQAIVEQLLSGRWKAPNWPTFIHHELKELFVTIGDGAIVVIPARHHAHLINEINHQLAQLAWVLVILTGDEEGSFPVDQLTHPRMLVWVQTPQPDRTYPATTRWLPNGPTPAAYRQPWGDRTRDVVFAGQVTHSRREACATAVQSIIDAGRTGTIITSPGFTQGLPQDEYLALMASARTCPAPSGPVHVDTFRAWEALELGAVPVLDVNTPTDRGSGTYWASILANSGTQTPVWMISDWTALPAIVDDIASAWPWHASRTAACWISYQRHLAQQLCTDLDAITGLSRNDLTPDDQITVLIPTSPIPSNPSTEIIEKTIDSIRAQLPHAEIHIMCDSPNPSAEHHRASYEQYLYELTRLCREKWRNVLPIIHDEHLHQSGMTRLALDTVTTPLILFVEHDTPIYGPIDWPGLCATVTSTAAGVVRLHHEAIIHPEHAHLMLGDVRPVGPTGVPLIPTQQWSQRPHLADTYLYRQMLAEHLPGRRMMIEDKMHGVLQDDWGVHGTTGWEKWRLYIYAPQENTGHGLKRSWHTDGRAGDDKWIGS